MPSLKDQWPTTEALVFSVDWFEGIGNEDYPHYQVVYSYRVNEEHFTGQFLDYISEQDDYLHRDSAITVRYNPDNPSKSFYPNAQTATNRRLVAYGIVVILAIIAILIAYLSGTFK